MILGAEWSANLDNFSPRFIDFKTIGYHLIQGDNRINNLNIEIESRSPNHFFQKY
jgi:hypothetical protein